VPAHLLGADDERDVDRTGRDRGDRLPERQPAGRARALDGQCGRRPEPEPGGQDRRRERLPAEREPGEGPQEQCVDIAGADPRARERARRGVDGEIGDARVLVATERGLAVADDLGASRR
jgi:hypothetical protein